ncbi:PREDICTED: exonuclease V-like isoform X2 [Priapulus caudatus]|uniref:Exonuclease V-like isoform X2 n=1 Tax=Priapulus caudatus TaxID=37621 RepID=A0ABM1EXC5_PRICU|nr:PREDICTED: exonuclease V-like isoform X2 [Priapulus caudatus]
MFTKTGGKYIWVSDLMKQLWCEQQMVYEMEEPSLERETPAMKAGTDLHLARELAVQDIVNVEITSPEDAFAVKLINLIGMAEDFATGAACVRREIPVFGAPYGEGLFLSGIVDEIRCDAETFQLDVVEMKTRANSKTLPSTSQMATHRMQVMLYKKLFDDLVRGAVTKATIALHLRLRLDRRLGDDVLHHLGDRRACDTLGSLTDFAFARLQSLPFVARTTLEYCHQADACCFEMVAVDYDDAWLRAAYARCAGFWRGARAARGVDVEEAWKCRTCEFADTCAWRLRRIEEILSERRSACSERAGIPDRSAPDE